MFVEITLNEESGHGGNPFEAEYRTNKLSLHITSSVELNSKTCIVSTGVVYISYLCKLGAVSV